MGITSIVGKKWEPRNPVPGPFLTKIRKVDENSESSQKFGKLILKIRKKIGNLIKIRKVCPENSEKFGKFGKIRKVCPENSENFGKFVRKIRKNSESSSGKFGKL